MPSARIKGNDKKRIFSMPLIVCPRYENPQFQGQ